MSDKITHITDKESFDSNVTNADLPVLVDFWAPWCGPCKMIAPVLDELAEDLDGKVKIVKINVDDYGEAAESFNVRGIPTLMIFKGGESTATKVGALSKAQLVNFVNEALA